MSTLTAEHAETLRDVVSSEGMNFEDCCGGYGRETAERFEELSRASLAFAALLRLADGEPADVTPPMLELVRHQLATQTGCLEEMDLGDEDYARQAARVEAIRRLAEHLGGLD